MDVQDGFIVGIYKYCDRWCETCAFTSRCRLFADTAEWEARRDPGLKPVVDAPPLPGEVPPPPPEWLRELFDESSEAADHTVSRNERALARPEIAPRHEPIEARAMAYSLRVHRWLEAHNGYAVRDPTDPLAVVAWFHTLVPAKIHRALTGFAADDPESRDWPADFDGSAKVALLGIERSHVAWLQLLDRGRVSHADVDRFVGDLVWLGEAVEREFPQARAFVRPGFDEPAGVARLLASEGLVENDSSGDQFGPRG
jgi:hypothetical protein